MSTYDYIKYPDNSIQQIKTWSNEMNLYKVTDIVPKLHSLSTYSIIMRDGSLIRVENCVLVIIHEHPLRPYPEPCFDKWGIPYSEGVTTGPDDEPYFFHLRTPSVDIPDRE